MRSLLTKRRLAGLALAIAAFALLALAAWTGRPVYVVGGVALLAVIGMGLMAGLMQRVMVVMQLSAATRADTVRVIGQIEALVPALRREVAEQSAVQRKEMERLRTGLEAELARQAGVQAAHGAALTFALDEALHGLNDKHQRAIARLEKLGGDADALRELVADGTSLTDRTTRGLTTAVENLRKLTRNSMQAVKTEITREVEALMQLRSLLQVDAPTPLLGGWAMDPEATLALVRYVLEHKPAQVVELGSGSSTLWLALALRRAGHGKLLSFDHLEGYAAKTAAALREHRLEDVAEVRVAPLVPVRVDDVGYEWYDLSPNALPPTDLLIVDGPPGGTGPMARFPALPMLREALQPGAAIVVDDAGRADELRMTTLWKQRFPELADSEPLGPRTLMLHASQSAEPNAPVPMATVLDATD